jgi:hypothetical protein
VKPSVHISPRRTSRVIACPVAGFGVVRGGSEFLAALRRNPVPAPGEPLPPTFLKHAGEQAIAGLAAVYQAIHNHYLSDKDFERWGVIAAPQFHGRTALAHALQRYAIEGAWGISPHLIPHHSLHALSGTVSQSLKIHGPNFGVGGGPGAVAEALLLAASLLGSGDLPGLWVVLSEHEPEWIPTEPGQSGFGVPGTEGATCTALALALVPDFEQSMGIAFKVCPQADMETFPAGASWPVLTGVGQLADAFADNGFPAGHWRLGKSGWLELKTLDIGSENQE